MTKATLFRSLVAICFVFSAAAAQAGTIATWTFETNPPTTAGPLSPDVGAGTANAVLANLISVTSPSGNGSEHSWNSRTWTIGDYYEFKVSTLGRSDITFTWDQTRSSSGPGGSDPAAESFKVQYSTDGTNFTDGFNYAVPITGSTGANWTSQSLSGIPPLDNQADVYFRITAILASTSTTNAQNRVDNVSVTFVPEPASTTLLLVAALIVGIRRRVR
jgi:hypothetical protein